MNLVNICAFTTGAHIVPMVVGDEWRWVVTEFEDDTFIDGACVNPVEACDASEPETSLLTD